MTSRRLGRLADGWAAVLLAPSLLLMPIACAQEKPAPEETQVPAKVMAALEARFPGAKVREWSQDKEGDIVVVDVEFEVDGRKLEADIEEDGTIHNWEREISESDLPAAIRVAMASKYPTAALQEIMETTAVKDGKEVLEEYEIVIEAGADKQVEVTLAPDGTFLEESGGEQRADPE